MCGSRERPLQATHFGSPDRRTIVLNRSRPSRDDFLAAEQLGTTALRSFSP
jgi:hypothetical protein